MSINAIIVDDHRLFAEGLAALLGISERTKITIVHTSSDGLDINRVLKRRKIHLVFLDLNLGRINGLDMIGPIKEISPSTKILVVSGYQNPKFVKSAFLNGADGYLLKGSPLAELEDAIESVMANNTFMGNGVEVSAISAQFGNGTTSKGYLDSFSVINHLTKREHEVLKLITQAFSNKEIAQKLFISDQTVSVHRKNIMRKLGVSNTVSLVKAAQILSIT